MSEFFEGEHVVATIPAKLVEVCDGDTLVNYIVDGVEYNDINVPSSSVMSPYSVDTPGSNVIVTIAGTLNVDTSPYRVFPDDDWYIYVSANHLTRFNAPLNSVDNINITVTHVGNDDVTFLVGGSQVVVPTEDFNKAL